LITAPNYFPNISLGGGRTFDVFSSTHLFDVKYNTFVGLFSMIFSEV
jgi:hypothetical protein